MGRRIFSIKKSLRPQVISIRCHIPNSSRAGNSSGRSDTRRDIRMRLYVGPNSVSAFQLGFTGMIRKAAANQEALGNSYTVEAAIETTAPVAYEQLRFGGEFIGTVPDGDFLLSDPSKFIQAVRPSIIYARTSHTIDSITKKFPETDIGWGSGGGDFISSNAELVSQVAGTGAMVHPTGDTTAFSAAPPFVAIGVPASPCPAIAIFGDSTADGAGDQSAGSLGGRGYIQRGLESVNGFSMPYVACTVGSNRLQYDTSVTGSKSRVILPYVTHAILELMGNDISGGASLATVQNYITNMCSEIKGYIGPYGKPIRIAVVKSHQRSDSSNFWVDLPGQTPRALGFGVGGIRDQINTWIDSQLGILFDDIIDPNLYWESQTDHGKWVIVGAQGTNTTDGTHPRAALHILASQAVNDWAKGLTI